MIEIENKIFDDLYNAIIAVYPAAAVDAVRTEEAASFPHVSITQEDSYTGFSSLSEREESAIVMFQMDVYTKTGKEDAKSIVAIIDAYMLGKGFVRTYCRPTPNIDRDIYRITARYKGEVLKGIVSGTTTTYQVKKP